MKTRQDYLDEAEHSILFQEFSSFLEREDYASYMELQLSKWEYADKAAIEAIRRFIKRKPFLLRIFYIHLYWTRGYHL